MFGDIDNDGDQDAFAGLTFRSLTESSGFAKRWQRSLHSKDQQRRSQNPQKNSNWKCDLLRTLDSDGKLDLFLGNGQTGWLRIIFFSEQPEPSAK